jgi:pimeloyl-ACP methyl ester carboxylesterase
MLFLHGALGSAAQFEMLRPHFPPETPVFALNLPGHGGLPTDAPYSMEGFAEAVLAFLDEKNEARAEFFGYSMGGYVALWLAWQHPGRVSRVVTLNTKFDWSPDTAARMSAMFDTEKIEAKVPQFAQALAQAHAPADWKQVARLTADFLRDLGEGKGLPPEAFGQIACPVTILRGELDNTVSAEESQRVADLLPQGAYREIPGGRHALEQVDAAAVVGALGIG